MSICDFDDVHDGLTRVTCGHVAQHPGHVRAARATVAVDHVDTPPRYTFTENSRALSLKATYYFFLCGMQNILTLRLKYLSR